MALPTPEYTNKDTVQALQSTLAPRLEQKNSGSEMSSAFPGSPQLFVVVKGVMDGYVGWGLASRNVHRNSLQKEPVQLPSRL